MFVGGNYINYFSYIIYFLSNAVSNMVANNGSIKEAFDYRSIWKIISNVGWLRYIGFYLGLIIIITVISIIVGIILALIWITLGLTEHL